MEKQRWEESERRREEETRSEKRKSEKKEGAGARKGTKVANHCVFPMIICGSRGSKSRLAKAAGVWREARFEVKMYKAQHARSSFGSCDVEKVHAVVARSTFRRQHVQNTSCSETFFEKVHAVVARSTFRSQKCKSWSTFGRSEVVLRGRRKGLCTLSKGRKTWGFCSSFKNNGRCGTFEEDLQRCFSRGRHSTRDMFIRDVRTSGRSFPERGCILEHQIFRFAKMILRDRCSTSCDLASLFRGRRSTLHRWSGKIAKRIGPRPSALHSSLHFWRKSRRIASFFSLVNFENWGSLTECFVFWRCQVQKLKKSRRIAAFLMLSSSKAEESLAEPFRFQACS